MLFSFFRELSHKLWSGEILYIPESKVSGKFYVTVILGTFKVVCVSESTAWSRVTVVCCVCKNRHIFVSGSACLPTILLYAKHMHIWTTYQQNGPLG